VDCVLDEGILQEKVDTVDVAGTVKLALMNVTTTATGIVDNVLSDVYQTSIGRVWAVAKASIGIGGTAIFACYNHASVYHITRKRSACAPPPTTLLHCAHMHCGAHCGCCCAAHMTVCALRCRTSLQVPCTVMGS
jgi:hypothetical protein